MNKISKFFFIKRRTHKSYLVCVKEINFKGFSKSTKNNKVDVSSGKMRNKKIKNKCNI